MTTDQHASSSPRSPTRLCSTGCGRTAEAWWNGSFWCYPCHDAASGWGKESGVQRRPAAPALAPVVPQVDAPRDTRAHVVVKVGTFFQREFFMGGLREGLVGTWRCSQCHLHWKVWGPGSPDTSSPCDNPQGRSLGLDVN